MKNFRKKAILFISLVLITATIAFANTFDYPGKPGKPKAMDWGSNFCEIEWTKPSHDGGSPIVAYRTEKKDKYSEWEYCGTTAADKTKRIVPDLIEGNTYEFRVIACNAAGDSEPSDASAPIITKPR